MIPLETKMNNKDLFHDVMHSTVFYTENLKQDKQFLTIKLGTCSKEAIWAREAWIMFNPKYQSNIDVSMIAYKIYFITPTYSINFYLISQCDDKKLFVHLANYDDYCYIRSNSKFIISKNNRGISGASISERYCFINIIYTKQMNNVKNSEFFVSYPIIKVNTDTDMANIIGLYPALSEATIHKIKIKKEIINKIQHTEFCIKSECAIDTLFESIEQSGLINKMAYIKNKNKIIEHVKSDSTNDLDMEEDEMQIRITIKPKIKLP